MPCKCSAGTNHLARGVFGEGDEDSNQHINEY